MSAYTPSSNSGYVPPVKKPANPVVIIAGLCGGCLLIVLIAVFGVGYFAFKKVGPFFHRSFNSGEFLGSFKSHRFELAESLLSPEAQSRYSQNALQKLEEGAESKYGRLVSIVPVFSSNSKDIDSLNNKNTFEYELVYEKGIIRVNLTFGPTQGNDKIDQIDWNTDTKEGSDGATGGHDRRKAKNTKSGGDGGDNGSQ